MLDLLWNTIGRLIDHSDVILAPKDGGEYCLFSPQLWSAGASACIDPGDGRMWKSVECVLRDSGCMACHLCVLLVLWVATVLGGFKVHARHALLIVLGT